MFDFTLRGEVVRRIGIISHAKLKALVRREIHVAGVGYRGIVDNEAISEGLKQEVADGNAPYTGSIFLHRHRCRQNITVEFHTVSLGRLQTEGNTLIGILRRDNRTGEQTGHRSTRKLLLLTCLGRCGLSVLHGLFRSLLIEQQTQGLVEEIFSIHPSMAKLIICELLHRSDTFLVKELHIVAGVTIEKIISAYTKPEQMNLLVGSGCIVIHIGKSGRGKRTVAAEIRELIQIGQTDGECLIATT